MRRSALAVLVAVIVSTAACGSRRDLEEGAISAAPSVASAQSAVPSGVAPAPAEAGTAQPGGGDTQAAALASPSSPAAQVPAAGLTGTPAGLARGGSTEAKAGAQASPAAAAGAGPAPTRSAQAPRPGEQAVPAPTPAMPSNCAPKCAPVVVGHVGTYSGVFSGFANGPKALEAWGQATNAKGGLDGHPVKVIIGEDGGDPARHRALVQQLVEQEGAIAFVDCFCPTTGQAAVDYLTKKGVPMVGGSPSSEWYYDSPMYFPHNSSGKKAVVKAILGGTAEIAVAQGKSKMAILACNEAQICKNLTGDMPKFAPEFGLKVVSQAQASLAQPDYTAECLAARNAGADIMFLAFDPNSYGRVANSCNSVGYKPLYSIVPDATNSVATIDAMDGAVVYSGVFPWFDTSHPAIAEMHRAMQLYTPRAEADQTAGIAWVASQLFEKAARGRLSATPTSQDILSGLWSIQNDNLGGLTYPIAFIKGQNAPIKHCWWAVVIKGRAFTSPNRNTRCA